MVMEFVKQGMGYRVWLREKIKKLMVMVFLVKFIGKGYKLIFKNIELSIKY